MIFFFGLCIIIISKMKKVLGSYELSHSLKHHICYIRYIATIDGLVHKRHLIAISDGTTIEGVHCIPDIVELLPREPDMQRARLRIVVNLSVFEMPYQFYYPILVMN